MAGAGANGSARRILDCRGPMDSMITSFNFYYAHAGRERSVLQQRLLASDVRQKLGLPRGRVLERLEGPAALPDVIWELQFDDVGGHHADMAVRAASAEFEAVRAGMRVLCRRFERPLFERLAAAAGGPAPVPSERAVTLDCIFCAPETVSAAIAIIEAHAGRLAQRGLDPGALLRRITPGNDLPDLIWQHEYADVTQRVSVQSQVARHFGIEAWPSRLDSAARRVECSVWSARGP